MYTFLEWLLLWTWRIAVAGLVFVGLFNIPPNLAALCMALLILGGIAAGDGRRIVQDAKTEWHARRHPTTPQQLQDMIDDMKASSRG